MDVRMPNLDGIDATRRLLRATSIPPEVLILTRFDLDGYVYEAIRAGASGFLLKSAPPQQLVDAVRAVLTDDALLAPQITRRLLERFIERPPPATGHHLKWRSSPRGSAKSSGWLPRACPTLRSQPRSCSPKPRSRRTSPTS
jgi:DNA-binding NarL/FixJ family response regulator